MCEDMTPCPPAVGEGRGIPLPVFFWGPWNAGSLSGVPAGLGAFLHAQICLLPNGEATIAR